MLTLGTQCQLKVAVILLHPLLAEGGPTIFAYGRVGRPPCQFLSPYNILHSSLSFLPVGNMNPNWVSTTFHFILKMKYILNIIFWGTKQFLPHCLACILQQIFGESSDVAIRLQHCLHIFIRSVGIGLELGHEKWCEVVVLVWC